jgi:ammonia channel protein AmtB
VEQARRAYAIADLRFQEGVSTQVELADARLLLEQALANGAAIVWSFAITFGLMKLLALTIGVRVDEEQEATGLDLALHGETAYHSGSLG